MRRFLALVTLLACGWLGNAHAFEGTVTNGACYRYPDGAIAYASTTKANCQAWTLNYGASRCSDSGFAIWDSGPNAGDGFPFYANWNTYPSRQYLSTTVLGGPNNCGSSTGGVV